MSREPLQERLDTLKLAKAGAVLKGTVPSKAMPRLTDGLVGSAGDAEAELEFDLDSVGRPVVTGRARAEVELTCQRCLEPLRQPLSVEFTLVQVRSESEAESLAPDVDPLLCEEPLIRSAQLIEDELILALPIIAVHADPACGPEERKTLPEVVSEEKPNPFAALAKLKRNEH